MRLRRLSGVSKMRGSALALAVALSLIGCAGSPATDTVPLCPAAGADEADGFEIVLDHEQDDPRLAPFVRYFEELMHYCMDVLPAWRDARIQRHWSAPLARETI